MRGMFVGKVQANTLSRLKQHTSDGEDKIGRQQRGCGCQGASVVMWEEELKHYLNIVEVRNREVDPSVIYILDSFLTSCRGTQKRPIWQPLIKKASG